MVVFRAAPAFASTRYSTGPLPVPDPPDVIPSQLAFSVAVHTQPDPAVTLIVPCDASEPTLAPVGEMLNTHGDGLGEGGGAGVGPGGGIGSEFDVAPSW